VYGEGARGGYSAYAESRGFAPLGGDKVAASRPAPQNVSFAKKNEQIALKRRLYQQEQR